MSTPRLALWLFAPLLLAACGDSSEDGGEEPADRRAEGPVADRFSREIDRSRDPRLAEAREALDGFRFDAVRTLLDQIGPSAGVEGALLRARLLHYEGDLVGALREVEAARRDWPGEARVYATAAEVYAWEGLAESAEDELRRARELVGAETPDLKRARGVYLLSIPGGAEAGLQHIEEASAADPRLPYARLPRYQGHLLLGRQLLGQDGGAIEAVRHALAARELDPASFDARELHGEALASAGHFTRAVEVFEELADEGRDVAATLADLHARAGMADLLESQKMTLPLQAAERRNRALDHWIRARDLGLERSALGFGADALAEETTRRLERGIAAWEAGELEGARSHFDRALECDPDCLEARDHLGVVLFDQERYGAAALTWEQVLADAERLGVDLPVPVHLNLSRALVLSGQADEAKAVLVAHLEAKPDSEWGEQTRELLASFP